MNKLNLFFSNLPIAAIVAICCTVAPGCKSNGNSELLERELRCQEDRIYKLEDELDEMCYALESSRRENESLKKELSGGDKGAGGRRAPSNSGPPRDLPLAAPAIDAPDLDALPVDEPASEAPRFLPKSGNSPDLDEAPPFRPPSGGSSLNDFEGSELQLQPASIKGKPLTGDANRITRLVINRQLTGGWNADEHYGDEGVFVAFEPRDANNKLVEAVGEVSIVVLDPSQTGAAARVARWDYTTDETEMHFRTGPIGRGLQFELPWPSDPPTSRDLRLFVRLKKPDGESIETEAKIRVTPCENWSSKAAPPKSAAVDSSGEPGPDASEGSTTVATEATDESPSEASPPRPASRLTTSPRPWAPIR